MDISDTLAPNSDQLDAVDLLSGPRIFTIERVSKGNSEQPVNVHLAEFPRPWRPGKSMRRVLAACWGTKATEWVGRRVKLFCDPDVRFGGQAVGGTRVEALSHIAEPKQVPLLVSRGKSMIYTVEPLPDSVQSTPVISIDLLMELTETLARKGIPDDNWLTGVNRITGGSATGLESITEDEARQVLASLADRPDAPESAQAATPPAAKGSTDDAAPSSDVQQREERLSGVRPAAAAPEPEPVEEPASGEAAETSTGRDSGPRCTVTQQADINRHFGRLDVAEHAERVWWMNYLADLDNDTVDATKQLKKSEAVKVIAALERFSDRDALDASINQDSLLGDQVTETCPGRRDRYEPPATGHAPPAGNPTHREGTRDDHDWPSKGSGS